MTTVMAPSMMNLFLCQRERSQRCPVISAAERGTHSQRQAPKPLAPSIPFVIPAAISPEKAPLIKLPAYSIAVRSASSFRVYQLDKKKRQPGKYAASTKPKQKRTATRPPKEWVAPLQPETIPHTIMMVGRKSDGRPMWERNRFEGTCIRM